MPLTHLIMFLTLTGIYEPSAIQQLPDGRFLIAEDEKTHPFSLVTIHPDGTTVHSALDLATQDTTNSLTKLDDLEGITTDAGGFIYVITSHSRNNAGEEKKSREKLVRFRIEGERVVSPVVFKGLKAALTAAHPLLAKAAGVLNVKTDDGLNIEALEMTPDRQRLLIGFRSPLLERRAVIARIDNLSSMFASDKSPAAQPLVSSQLVTLDLGGHGIRGMSYVPALSGYLVISGPVTKEQVQFQLWFWSGNQDDRPRHVTVPGLPGFAHAEGVSPAMINGRQRIIVVSDDGSREEARPARFLLLDPAQLQIAPSASNAPSAP